MKAPCERPHVGDKPESTATVEHMMGPKSIERVCTQHANELERNPQMSEGPIRIIYDAVEPYRDPKAYQKPGP